MSLEPSRKFGLGDAITFGVAIFRASISARISPKNHRFWRAFSCNYLRRVDFFVVLFLLEFRQKIIDFGVLFDAITFGGTIFCDTISARISTNIHQSSILFEFRRKIIDLCVLFDALTFRVSILCDCISVRIPTKNYQFLRTF